MTKTTFFGMFGKRDEKPTPKQAIPGKKVAQSRQLSFESLEERALLSVSPQYSGNEIEQPVISLNSFPTLSGPASTVVSRIEGGYLVIEGTNEADRIEIEQTTENVNIRSFSADGLASEVIASYEISAVSGIYFYGYDGDDIFRNEYANVSATIPVYLYGGDGDDNLVGGLGDDSLFGGEGNDYLYGTSGNNILDGGNGDNMLIGGFGANIYYNEGLGSTAFVWMGHDNAWAAGSSNDSAGKDDAQLVFGEYDLQGNTYDTYAGVDFTFRAWTSSEVFEVLDAVHYVYSLLGNYLYFRDNSVDPIYTSVYKQGEVRLVITDETAISFVGMNYMYRYICLVGSKLSDDTTIHEFAHNWDNTTSNSYWSSYMAISWNGVSSMKTEAILDDFARSYGMTGGAYEDWATAISYVLHGDQRLDATEKWFAKTDIIHDFLNSVGTRDIFESLVVTTELDILDANDGLLSLREAILLAGGSNGTLITFAPEMDGKTILLNDEALYIGKTLTIDASDVDLTIDAAGADTATAIFTVTSATVSITGLNLQGSKGMYTIQNILGSILKLSDVIISGNTNTFSAIYSRSSSLWFVDSQLLDNTAQYAIYSYGETSGYLKIANSVIAGNSTSSSSLFLGDEAEILNSLIVGNYSPTYSLYVHGSKVATVDSSTIVGNVGYVLLSTSAVLTVNNSIIANNPTATTNCIAVSSAGAATLNRSLVGYLTSTSGITFQDGTLYGSSSGSLGLANLFVNMTAYTSGNWSNDLWKSWDLRLGSSSIALGIGNTALLPVGLDVDIERNARTNGGLLDLGAYQMSRVDAPTDFQALEQSANSLSFEWAAVEGATSYTIQISTNGIDFSDATTAVFTGECSASIDGLNPGTAYTIRLIAVLDEFVSSPIDLKLNTNLASPANFIAGTATKNSVAFSWTVADEVDAYILQYSTDGGDVWTTGASLGAVGSASLDGLRSGTDYQFRLIAKNELSESDPAVIGSVITTRLDSPEGFDHATIGSSSVALSWNTVEKATGYHIDYSSDEGDNWTTGTSVDDILTGTIFGLTPGQTYSFRIQATNPSTDSEFVQLDGITTLPELSGTGSLISETENSLLFSLPDAIGHTAYDIQYRPSSGGEWISPTAANIDFAAKTAVITGLDSANEYEIQFRAKNTAGTTAWSNSHNGTTNPASPGGISVTEKTTTSISLEWSAVTGAESYLLEYSVDGTSWSTGATTSATAATVEGLDPNTAYYFRVFSQKSELFSATSEVFGPVVSMKLLDRPEGLIVVSKFVDSLEISWNEVSGADYYELYRTLAGNDDPIQVYSGAETTFFDAGLNADTEYLYFVKTFASDGYSLNSEELEVRTSSSSAITSVCVTEIRTNAARTGFEVVFSGALNLAEKIANGTILDDFQITLEGGDVMEISAAQFNYDSVTNILYWNSGSVLAPGEYLITFVPGKFYSDSNGVFLGGTGANFSAVDQEILRQVFDYTDGKDTFEYVFSIRPPQAVVSGTSFTVQEGCTCSISGVNSYDYNYGELEYLWDLDGSGNFTVGNSSVVFSTKGIDGKPDESRTVSFKVRDEFGFESETIEITINIIDVAPGYSIVPPAESNLVAGNYGWWLFKATDITQDPVVAWIIEWGDGTETVLEQRYALGRILLTHQYSEPGEYTVTVTTKDDDGITSSAIMGSYFITAAPNPNLPIVSDISVSEPLILFDDLEKNPNTNLMPAEENESATIQAVDAGADVTLNKAVVQNEKDEIEDTPPSFNEISPQETIVTLSDPAELAEIPEVAKLVELREREMTTDSMVILAAIKSTEPVKSAKTAHPAVGLEQNIRLASFIDYVENSDREDLKIDPKAAFSDCESSQPMTAVDVVLIEDDLFELEMIGLPGETEHENEIEVANPFENRKTILSSLSSR